MDTPLNPAPPEIMHIDLNACFAMTEQQANPLLRGRPIAVTNRLGSDFGTIIAPSYEAKRLGVRCGTSIGEAKKLAPGIVILETDPPKYRYVHQVLKAIFEEYSPHVTMKSIDEGVLDFRGTSYIRAGRSLQDIGHDIKARVREELGEWMTVNVGIGPNWFLAKLAAGLNKPDGLDTIDATNLEGIYLCSNLLDLNGINRRFRARLMAHDIYTPYEFLQAPERVLTKQVFRSINGRHWYLRLRGYEVDDISTTMRHVGKQYVLHHATADPTELSQILYKLCYYISRRLAKYDRAARGLELSIRYRHPDTNPTNPQTTPYVSQGRALPTNPQTPPYVSLGRVRPTNPPSQTPPPWALAPEDAPDESTIVSEWAYNEGVGTKPPGSTKPQFGSAGASSDATLRWSLRQCGKTPFFTLADLHLHAMHLFAQSPPGYTVSQFTLTTYNLEHRRHEQLALYQTDLQQQERLEQALQSVNDRYGELTMAPASILEAGPYVPDKIAFGSVRYLTK